MGNWFIVTKKIHGRLYDYWQRTERHGRQVKTFNKYIGPARSATVSARTTTTQRYTSISPNISLPSHYEYHGTPKDLNGTIQPSKDGLMGPGFYLAPTYDIAEYFGKQVVYGMGRHTIPDLKPNVYAFDTSSLKLKELNDKYGYYDFVDANGGSRDAALLCLANEGYDGIRLSSRGETVVFPKSVTKLVSWSEDEPAKHREPKVRHNSQSGGDKRQPLSKNKSVRNVPTSSASTTAPPSPELHTPPTATPPPTSLQRGAKS